jgi:AraC-like DNA-binding protein
MNNNMIENLNYPKPNSDSLYAFYNFEIKLIEYILNGEEKHALRLYDEFFSKEYTYSFTGCTNSLCIKNYIISISLLICHSVIKKGVSSYSANAKCHAFSILIENSKSKTDVINIGKKMIKAYIKQVASSIHNVDNVPIRKAIDYIHDNLGEDLSLDMVANHANLSRCYFCTQFKKQVKMNFTEYLTYTRIEKSKYLLCNSDKSILDIAVLIGFNSQSYFTTNFKKHTGVTPKEFREKNNIDYIF